MTAKRHHYVPIAYLKRFCNHEGKLYVYRKDSPGVVRPESPKNAAVRGYYYSQPQSSQGKDHDSLEKFFNDECESQWPNIVDRLLLKKDVTDCREDIINFIILQRARVPASRDACETVLAESVKAAMRHGIANGDIPPPPKGHENILKHIDVAIDPHQSIHAMVDMIRGMKHIFSRIGISALHNKTDIQFLTSDNPVIWFDPSISEQEMRPYTVRPEGPIVLLFPVTPNLMIYGHSSMRDRFAREGFAYGEILNPHDVEIMNTLFCRFAYEAVFARTDTFNDLVSQYAALSPVVQTQVIPHNDGELMFHQYVWGKRRRKPKWKKPE